MMPIVTTQIPPQIDLATLNGQTGFVIKGVSAGDATGRSVSSAGDINGDGVADILVGAITASPGGINQAGKSYVIFGKSGLGDTGILALFSLNGSNGYVINGVAAGDRSSTGLSGVGDINVDGIEDFAIGAPDASWGGKTVAGISYVVFGRSGLGGNGVFNLTSLTGQNGFILTQNTFVGNGESISFVGDVNGDGIADLLIGGTSTAWVIFGRSGLGSSGALDLTTLNGTNGFIINGVSGGECTVSGAGDVNDDGINDILIGVEGASPLSRGSAGITYVIFGMNGLGSSGSINLSNLNGANGFAMYGATAGEFSGYAVSQAGDVNGDGIADILIGAYLAAPAGRAEAGKCYIVFGKSGLGSGGSLDLSTLNGMNGFTIYGASPYDDTGYSVSAAGDVNSDGIADILLGAYNASPGGRKNAGRSYVIFGKSGIGGSGLFDLSTLNGINGVALNGISPFDYSGVSVSAAGDVNADGITDFLIGASGTGAGSAYVIFGDTTTTQLVKNSLTVQGYQPELMTMNNLNATCVRFPQHNNALIFTITNPQHGYFAFTNNPSQSITNFTQGMVRNSQIEFVYDLSGNVPSYNVSVNYGGLASIIPPQPAAITLILLGPLLINNVLFINQGQTSVFSSSQLSAFDQDNPAVNPNLIFTIRNLAHGVFEFVGLSGISISSFTQNQITGSQVQFIHDGSTIAPSYNVTVSDARITTSSQAAMINFNLAPILINNSIIIGQGQKLILTSSNLSATDSDDSAGSLIFQITNIQHGSFELVTNPGSPITSFTQAQLDSGDIQFVHDARPQSPSYSVSVSDGKTSDLAGAVPASITFRPAPSLLANTLLIGNGQTVILNAGFLSAGDSAVTASNLVFTITNIQHGKFTLVSNSTQAITTFSLAQIQTGTIQFIHDGSNIAPSYSVSVSDGTVSNTGGAVSATIKFNYAPTLVTNQLAISQGQTVILTADSLSATDSNGISSGNLIFTANGIQHGSFHDLSINLQVTSFLQQKITSSSIQFMSDGSLIAPAYNISVSDGILSTLPVAAKISFVPQVSVTAGNSNTIRDAIIGTTVSAGVTLLFFVIKLLMSRVAERNLKHLLEEGQSRVEKQQAQFQKEVVLPIATHLFASISTTNCLGYRSERETRAYIVAIESIVGKMRRMGIKFSLGEADSVARTKLIDETAKQISQRLVPDRSCCSKAMLYRFFTSEITPQQIEANADEIVQSITATVFASSTVDAKNIEMTDIPVMIKS